MSRDAHQSPIGIKACTPLLDGAGAPPLAPVVPQKTVGAAPRPEVMITDLMASLSGPTLRWLAARAQRSRQPLTRAVMTVSGRRPNQIWWLQANPKLGLAVPPFTRSSAPNRTEPCRASHGSMPGQLMRHRLDRYRPARLGRLALVEPLGAIVVAHREVRRLDKRPGEMSIAAFAVAAGLALAVAGALSIDATAIRREVAGPGEAADIAGLQQDRQPQGAVTVTGWCQLRVASSFLL